MLQPDLGPVGDYSEGGILVSVSKRKIKAVVRELDHVDTRVGLPSREAQTCPLTFTKDDLKGILMPHNDPLVISKNIIGTKVHRLLVDTGSYANIIFRMTLDKLGNYETVQTRVSMLERDLTKGLRETRPAGDQAQGEELNTAASDDDQKMIDAGVQEAGASRSIDQHVEVSNQVKTPPPDLEPRIGFKPMETGNELDPTGHIFDPRWKSKK
ncbi:hypothetical protein ACS0TY_011397 [Phlomoides rotata]